MCLIFNVWVPPAHVRVFCIQYACMRACVHACISAYVPSSANHFNKTQEKVLLAMQTVRHHHQSSNIEGNLGLSHRFINFQNRKGDISISKFRMESERLPTFPCVFRRRYLKRGVIFSQMANFPSSSATDLLLKIHRYATIPWILLPNLHRNNATPTCTPKCLPSAVLHVHLLVKCRKRYSPSFSRTRRVPRNLYVSLEIDTIR